MDQSAVSTRTEETPRGALSVLNLSTIAFTLMFACWTMFGILGVPIQRELGIDDAQLAWISAAAILNGSLWRLPAGILADRFGGRIVFTVLLLASAGFSILVAVADNYGFLLVAAFLVGFSGNSFTAGTAWNSAWFPRTRQGFALGLFGAGNVGASLTKFIGPVVISATAGTMFFGFIAGGWRLIPVVYAVLLILVAGAVWFLTPSHDRMPGRGTSLRHQLQPLRRIRVWRFSLYYVAVFGAYVALSTWLPKYYIDNYDVDLGTAGLLTALFIFPASLLRPLGGWMADRIGARRVMYWTFGTMLATTGLLAIPDGLGSIVGFTIVLFVLGCAMGVGKAAVYKYIPEYFAQEVGSVGGVVGMLGGLGGFFLPPLFAGAAAATSLPTSTFAVLFVLTAVCALWLHLAVRRIVKLGPPVLA